MTFKGHLVFAATSYALVNQSLWQTVDWQYLPLVLFASILPDADQGESKIHHLHWMLSLFLFPLRFLKHRGLTHSLSFWLLVSYGVWWLAGPLWGFAFAWGYATHIFVDALTPHGVSLFAPLVNSRWSLNLFTTGSFWEGIVALLPALGWLWISA